LPVLLLLSAIPVFLCFFKKIMSVLNDKKIWIPDADLPRVVIIGAGFGGISLTKKLRSKQFSIVLIDQNNFHQFPPLFYQVATSGLEPDAISFPVRKLFKGYKNFIFRMACVEEINPDEKRVYTDEGFISYDYLVIATGSTTNFYGLDNVEKYGIGLKSVKESLDLRSLMLENLEKAAITTSEQERDRYTNVVIVGGGPAGIEIAGALAEYKRFVLPQDYPYFLDDTMKIYLVEAGPRLLMAMSATSSDVALKELEKMGVEVLLNTGVKSYNGEIVDLGDKPQIEAATLIWTAGVKGSFPKGMTGAVIVPGNRIEVNEFNQVVGYENIFAIGDVGGMISAEHPKGHPMVAPAAIQQGEHLAKNIQYLEGGRLLAPFVYHDKGSLATIGRKRAVAELGRWKFKGFFAWIIWSTVHLLSIIGFKNKIFVGLSWFGSYLTHDKGNRLIIRKYRRQEAD
jgi:NADH:quinone reductase (non-electrogenic)